MAYDFSGLSPTDFEHLVGDLLSAEHGLRFESFAEGRDEGIDLRHRFSDGRSWVVQCKHWRRSGAAKLVSHARRVEAPKVRALAPDRYLLATSVSLSPAAKDSLVAAFAPFVAGPGDVLGAEDLNSLLRSHPEVEKSHVKLWLTSAAALERLLNADIVNVTQGHLADLARRSSLYVQNASFGEALTMLEEHHACVIAGPPGIGKTMLADMLLLHYVERGFEPVVIMSGMVEADRAYREVASQVFSFDDFLGQTALAEKLAKNDDARLVGFIERVGRSPMKRFVMTTREYLLRQAASTYEPLARAADSLPKYVLDLPDYTQVDRARILYNHVWFSDLDPSVRAALVADQRYMTIVDHPNYSPRLIEGVIKQGVSRQLTPVEFLALAESSLDDPARLWSPAYEAQIGAAGRAMLKVLAVLDRFGCPFDRLVRVGRAVAHEEGDAVTAHDCRMAIRQMEGTFVQIEVEEDAGAQVTFQNPSIRDFMLNELERGVDVLGVIVGECEPDELLTLIRYGNARRDQRDDEVGQSLPQYPMVRRWLRTNIEIVAAAYGRTVDESTREGMSLQAVMLFRELQPSHQPEFVGRALALLGDRWELRQGNAASGVRLLEVVAEAGWAEPDELARLERSIADWVLASQTDHEDFDRLLALLESRPSALTDEERERSIGELEVFLGSEVDWLDEECEISELEDWLEQFEDLRQRAEEVGADTPSVDHLQERLEEMQTREDLFDPLRPGPVHIEDSEEEIHAMFSTLIDP